MFFCSILFFDKTPAERRFYVTWVWENQGPFTLGDFLCNESFFPVLYEDEPPGVWGGDGSASSTYCHANKLASFYLWSSTNLYTCSMGIFSMTPISAIVCTIKLLEATRMMKHLIALQTVPSPSMSVIKLRTARLNALLMNDLLRSVSKVWLVPTKASRPTCATPISSMFVIWLAPTFIISTTCTQSTRPSGTGSQDVRCCFSLLHSKTE